MKNKKQFTLIELIIVIVVIGILAAMALPKFNGVVRDAKISAMIRDKETLEKTLIIYNQKYDNLPLLNEDEEFAIAKEGLSLTKIVLAEEATNEDMKTIYTSLKETLSHYNDSENSLYRIDISKLKDNLSKNIKYGYKKNNKDFYVYSTKTGNVYYYDAMINGNDTIQHTEYDTLIKENELVNKLISPVLNEDFSNIEDNTSIKNNTISLGGSHSANIGRDGNLYSWGDNTYGQLGLGDTINRLNPQLVNLPNGEKPISISLGEKNSMVITNKGNLYAWGSNNYGQLGIDNKLDASTPKLVKLPPDEKPIYISSGYYHSMIITEKGNLYAWGDNSYGELGIGNTTSQMKPQKVILPNEEKPKFISLGGYHSMIITEKGNLYAFGNNEYGQLGIGNKEYKSLPELVTLPNGEKPISISAGYISSMVITDKGNLYSWGSNAYGQLGIGEKTHQTIPQLVTIPNGEKPISIYAGFCCLMVITDKGNVYSCGYNYYGQLGIGNKVNQSTLQLIILPKEEKPISIYAGYIHSAIFTEKGNCYVSGHNGVGQLGIGNTTNQISPIKIDLP